MRKILSMLHLGAKNVKQLLLALLLAFTLACGACAFVARRVSFSAPPLPAAPAETSGDSRWLRLAGAATGIAAVLIYHLGEAPLALWFGGMAALRAPTYWSRSC